GLSGDEAEKRIKKYGYNEIKAGKKDTALKILMRQFKAFVVWVLLAAACISFSLGHIIEVRSQGSGIRGGAVKK
ncbi:MAG: hypothetical protein KKD12_04325, partial [Proteobacteria bacterium]|nr:hypothetical protein [Pseudomonadota bacterium]